MKRCFVFLLLVVMLFPGVGLCAESTKTRNLAEFCELFIQRITILKYEYGIDCDVQISPYGLAASWSDSMLFSTSAGEVVITYDEIVKVVMSLYDLNDDNIKRQQSMLRCVMAMSVLEYNTLDDRLLEQQSEFDPAYKKNAIEQMLSIWDNSISAYVQSSEFLDRLYSSDNPIVIYSGNYVYSLKYSESTHNGEEFRFVHLIAEAK